MTKDVEPNESSSKIQQIMQDNPDLSYEFVHQLLITQAEVASGDFETYEFGQMLVLICTYPNAILSTVGLAYTPIKKISNLI